MTTTATDQAVGQWARERARAVDEAQLPASDVLPELAAHDRLDIGIEQTLAAVAQEGVAGRVDLREQADVIGAVAGECLSSAFSLWGHRMALEYFARGERSARSEQTFAAMRRGELTASSAMAAAMKAGAGLGDLGVTGRREGDEIVLDGSIAWASNLVDGAVVVTAVAMDGEAPLVTWFTVGAPGVTVQAARGLLALESTASGRIVLDGVRTPADAVLSTDVPAYTAGFRPTLLLLQSAFCVGLTRVVLAEAAESVDRPETKPLAGDVEDLQARFDELVARFDAACADPASAGKGDLLRIRLDASHLCQEATRLGATLAGGRGYVASSTAARRLREAAFLPVQSPSEGHLRWELASLS